MAIALYMDQHVSRAITSGLRLRNVDMLTAYEDGASELDDAALLDRATTLGRVLFSQDDDLLAEATHRQEEGISFSGVIYAHQLRLSIWKMRRELGACCSRWYPRRPLEPGVVLAAMIAP